MPETTAQTRAGSPRIVALGARAATALAYSDGTLRQIPGFARTPYRLAGAEIVWVGTHGEEHPRAVFVDAPIGDTALTCMADLPIASPAHLHVLLEPESVSDRFGSLARQCHELDTPRGWGCLLLGATPPFPLEVRADAAHALAAAVAADDADGFARAGLRLLGVGAGLTPSGDDFVGAALFTLLHLDRNDATWRSAAHTLAQATHSRTHAISAALFADLARGQSFAPLHALLDAAADADPAAMLAPARRLIAIGHSSGWDMLAGMIAAATGTLHHPSH